LAGLAQAQAQIGQPPEACVQQFVPLRVDAEKRLTTAKQAMERKAPPPELCRLFTQFSDAEAKMIKYVETQGVWCGFPPDALPSMKAGHVKSLDARKQVCTAAAAGAQRQAAPPAPSLSDALGTSLPTASAPKTGRGTFDTLTGSPLGR
jgi:hypothetical protein